jgi:hypothetical protein
VRVVLGNPSHPNGYSFLLPVARQTDIQLCQEAYLWVKARDFCIHQVQRLQVTGAASMVDMHSKNYMNQLHSVRSVEQIRKPFTPKWLQLSITCGEAN